MERDQIIREVMELTGYSEGVAFLRAEQRAVSYTEYACDAIPTFAQVPGIARAYMQTYTDLSPSQIGLGVEARAIRAREAVQRKNTLYLTSRALAMDSIIDDNGDELSLEIPQGLRCQQLSQLAAVALQPHIELRLVPNDAPLPRFKNAIHMEFPDRSQAVAIEKDGGLAPLITDPAKVEYYTAGLAHLSMVALSTVDTIDAVQTALDSQY